VGLHDVLDMYIGNSEQRLHALFENAREHAPCVLFFDEVDALGSSRSDLKASSGRHLINQFLSELDGIDSVNDAFLSWRLPTRRGIWTRRFAAALRPLAVRSSADLEARLAILRVVLRGKPGGYRLRSHREENRKILRADLKAIVDQAVESKLEEALAKGVPEL